MASLWPPKAWFDQVLFAASVVHSVVDKETYDMMAARADLWGFEDAQELLRRECHEAALW